MGGRERRVAIEAATGGGGKKWNKGEQQTGAKSTDSTQLNKTVYSFCVFSFLSLLYIFLSRS